MKQALTIQSPKLEVLAWGGLAVLGQEAPPPSRWDVLRDVAVGAAGLGALGLLLPLKGFLRFHLRLLLENCTTIENLERDGGAASPFDRGWRANVAEVLGPTPWLWWLPWHTPWTLPAGDGLFRGEHEAPPAAPQAGIALSTLAFTTLAL